MSQLKYLAFDFETTRTYNMGYDDRAYPILLGIITSTGDKYSWIFNHDTVTPLDINKARQEIQDLIDNTQVIIAHNIKFDLHWLRRLGIDYSKVKLYCSQTAEYLINGENNRVRYALAETSLRYGIPAKHDAVKDWWDAGYETNEIPLNILVPYCMQDTANTLALYQKQQSIILSKNLTKLCNLSCELIRTLQEIEWNGMKLDVELCTNYSTSYGEQIENLYTKLNSFIRSNILDLHELPLRDTANKPLPNFGSGEQLSALLFGGELKYKGRVAGAKEGTTKNGTVILRTTGLGLVPRDGTETSVDGYYQTDKAQLQGLKVKNKTQRVFLEQLSELSKLEKMKGTYFDGMLTHVYKGIVHCNIKNTRTVTGRLSVTDPALQTIPRGSTSPVKQVFISRYN
jgi:DNA polymerase I-like protein with 3'-5' exonuclease and polymerase domains